MRQREPDDTVLMHRCANGEEAAFAQLIERYFDRLHAFAWRTVLNRHDAEEIVQETFLRVWRHAATWEPDGNARFSTWLFKIAHNLCIDRKRKPAFAPLEDAGALIDAAPNAETNVDKALLARRITSAMAELPIRQRAALALCYFDELSNRDAADALGIHVKALESLLSRGRRTLKQMLMSEKDHLLGGN